MQKILLSLMTGFIMLLALNACHMGSSHFLSDKDYRKEVMEEFERTRQIASHRSSQLFSVFEQELTLEEEEALKFLYAYMPLCDLADGNGDLFLQNVRIAFSTRDSFSWGSSIPEEVFRHFVLPYRVNNENLDSARAVFNRELLPRVKGLSLREAALEVNHWCHEKVTYQGTDSRTISPLGAVRTAFGRCGEESTFAVTALRSVGIPARQVYTPRWAHTDDNHAWVEVWVDGKWYYMGACEPEPDLNMGWFSQPVLRAMMLHTNTFGRYYGSEPVLENSPKTSKLNLTSNYTEPKEIKVQVVDTAGRPVSQAYVEFGLYNYAEFYPLLKTRSDKDGYASLLCGKGSLQVMASDGVGRFGLLLVPASAEGLMKLSLTRNLLDTFSFDVNHEPPPSKPLAAAPATGREEHNRRLAAEDSIRNAYVATFITETNARALAVELGLDTAETWFLLRNSRGNWREISGFLKSAAALNKQGLALQLLSGLAIKDLHDSRSDVLLDHLGPQSESLKIISDVSESAEEDVYLKYMVNPRIELELITPYRSLFRDSLGFLQKPELSSTISALREWVLNNIVIDSLNNYYNLPLTPYGAFELRRADPRSRDILFVAIARSLGIPSRLEPATRVPQFFNSGWIDVDFADGEIESGDTAEATWMLGYVNEFDLDPRYSEHFSLAVFKNNHFETLDYEWGQALSTFPWAVNIYNIKNMLPRGLWVEPKAKGVQVFFKLKPGFYKLTTGLRQDDGSAGVHQAFVRLEDKKIVMSPLIFALPQRELTPLAHWNESPEFSKSLNLLVWIERNAEPSKHYLRAMNDVKHEYEALDLDVLVLCPADVWREVKSSFPKQARNRSDEDLLLLGSALQALNADRALPAVILLDKQGNILYRQLGYSIGSPGQLLGALK